MLNADMEIKEMKVITKDGKEYIVFDLRSAAIAKDQGVKIIASSVNGVCKGGLYVMED